MAEIEFEVPGEHEPCLATVWGKHGPAPCGNTERFIRHVPTNMGKKLVCGLDHNQRGNAAFIAGHEFDVGGLFHGIVPSEFLPSPQSMRDSRWKIPADAAINDIDVDECISCRAPTYDFYGGPDIGHALPWLETYARGLYDAIVGQVELANGNLEDWAAIVSDELRLKIRKRLDMSQIEVDHAVPRKIGNDMWPLLTRPERQTLQVTLLVKACKLCNLGKSSRLVPREKIESWYVELHHGGNRSVAEADAVRWAVIGRTLEKVYHERAVG